jgi:hypothetical protein
VGWRQKLEDDCLSDLAFVAVTRDDLDRARYHVNQFYTRFVTKWATLHPLALAGRHIKLQSIQRMVELEEFLDFVRDDEQTNFANASKLEELLGAWEGRWPSTKLDGINVWDDITSTRAVLLEKLNERFSRYWAKEMARFEQVVEQEEKEQKEEKMWARVKEEPRDSDTAARTDGGMPGESEGMKTLRRVKQVRWLLYDRVIIK